MWVLKIVTDGQTDSLTNLIKCVVVYCSYSYAFWSTSLWAPGLRYMSKCIYVTEFVKRLFLQMNVHNMLACYNAIFHRKSMKCSMQKD